MIDTLDKNFKTTALKVLKELKQVWRQSRKQCINKMEIPRKTDNLKRNQKEILEWRHIRTEMKKSLEGFKGRLEEVEEKIMAIKNRITEIIGSDEQKEK